MLELDLHPDRKTLRRFGFASLVAFGALAAISHFVWHAPAAVVGAFAVLGVLSGLFAAVAPRVNLPLYLVLNLVFFPIGFVVSYVVLGVLFFAILTPVGLFFRLIGRDALRRKIEPDASTYWIPHAPAQGMGRYFRPF